MRKGFTLIELLAVITILAIILLIVYPIMSNVVKSSKDSTKKDSVALYGKAIEVAISDYYVKYPTKDFVTIEELESEGLINYKGTKVKCDDVRIVNRQVYLNNCKVGSKYVDYSYGEYNPEPVLVSGLTPVVYDGTKWLVVDSNDNWYNYDEQRWANAVTLLPGVVKAPGDEVKVDGTEASMMFVWIPRYEYKYTNLGDEYAGGTQNLPGIIDVNFISEKITTPSSNDYIIHPAFTFGTQELSGIWVAKFKLSKKSSEAVLNTSNLVVLPDKNYINLATVSNYFNLIKAVGTDASFGLSNVDTHMIKNSEWGAVAYLSQSKYGKRGNDDYTGEYKKIFYNGSVTSGKSKCDLTTHGVTKSDYNDMTNLSEGKGQCGPGASTTGNIYGIYDMNSIDTEFVMGIYESADGTINLGQSGFSENDFASINKKYYDTYKENTGASYPSNITCNNKLCYGHALFEIFPWIGQNDYNFSTSSSLISRGQYINSQSINIFSIRYTDGYPNSAHAATRITLITS